MLLNPKNSRFAALIGAASLLVAASAMAGGDYTTTSEDWETAYNAGDAEGVAALYTEDGMVMPPNAKPAQGREAIAALIQQDIDANKGNKLEVDVVEQGKNGNLGFARGTWVMTGPDGSTLDQGKWLEVRKKISGKWYIHSDIWNSDQAPAHQH